MFGDLLYFDTYLKSNTIEITPNKYYLSITDATKYFWNIYSKSIKTDENFEERVVRYTAIKVFMLIYEYVVDEEDVSVDAQLKILIELFFDMVKNTKNYHKILLGK